MIGNSVSPFLSSALARAILNKEDLKTIPTANIDFKNKLGLHESVNNLNTYTPKNFDIKRRRLPQARFRRSVHKSQNITIDLMNHEPGEKTYFGHTWYIYAFYGTGSNHKYDRISYPTYHSLQKILSKKLNYLDVYIDAINKSFDYGPISSNDMQQAYEEDCDLVDRNNPLVIINKIQELIAPYRDKMPEGKIGFNILDKSHISCVQALYMFTLANVLFVNLQKRGHSKSSINKLLLLDNKSVAIEAY